MEFDGANTIATIYGAKGTETDFDITDIATFPAAVTKSITITGLVTIDGVTLFGYNGATKTNSIDEVRLADTYANFFDLEASNTPSPEYGETVFATTDLGWSAPNTYAATGYDVYLGTDPNKLNLTKIADKITDLAIIDPAGTGLDLEFDTTYYWSVDAYEANGINEDLRAGSVWTFTTLPANVILNDGLDNMTVADGGVAVLSVDTIYADTFVSVTVAR